MKNTLLILSFLMIALFRIDAQQVVWDPAQQDPATLPAGMTIVNIDGTDYLQVILDGWNSSFNIEPVVIADHYTHFNCEVKYAVGTSGFAITGINTFLKVSTPSGVEQAANGAASTAAFAERAVALAVKDTIGIVQIAGQETTGWSAVAGDTLWVGKITLTGGLSELIPGFIARETFGTLSFDTNNPVPQPTGYATGYNWTDVTDFTSENGHIEAGSDSSVRINTYGNAYTIRGPLVDFSAGAHALIVDRAAYAGSWDTLLYVGIDLTNSVATAIEFSQGKAPSWFINSDTSVINVEYRIDGGDWIQLDTSLIDTLYKGIWDYVSLPVNYAEGSIMDVRLSALTTSQVTIDDLGVYGLIEAPQGTNEFSIANVVVGAVDDAADFTCNLTASWDVDSLYLNFVITDDSIVTSGNAYQVDNLEIYLDLDNSKNVHWPRNGGWLASVDAAYDANDFQFRLVPGVDFSVNNGSRPSTTNLSAVKQIYTVTDTGYNFTLNVAWDSLMADFDAVEEALIGFDVLVSDNDATASDANRNQITLNSPTDKPFNDPSLFATFAFKADGRFEIIPDETNPSVPANFAAECVDSVLTITWDNATDNIAVLQYEILQGGQVIATPYALATGNRYVIRDLAPADYNISIRALDNYGNTGPASSSYVNCPPVVSINPSIAEQFNIYPNPASSVLNIAAGGDVLNVQVISITGAVVMNINNQNQIDLSGLNAGLYMIKVATDSNIYSTTFVKE
jgi:hypothetical protein